ncbi:hypothetical protein [Mucilaginibacter pedocola]|nr:hypothetical protein [Mucilaginibacter pedocola]
MNKKILLLFVLVAAFLQGCKLDPPVYGPPPKEDWSASFQPLGVGSYWKYLKTTAEQDPDTAESRVTGDQPVINGRTYHTVYTQLTKFGGESYFYTADSAVTVRDYSSIAGGYIQIKYVIDSIGTVGQTWTEKITDDGMLNGYPARVVGTVIENNITKVLNGITYPRVRHTRMQLQQDKGSGFETLATYDYYIAMGVGVIENIGVAADGTDLGHSTLLSFVIKNNDIIIN